MIKAIRAGSEPHTRAADEYRGAADYLLFDAFSADAFGGTGRTIGEDRLKELEALSPSTRFFLAGGLNAGNVAEAVATVKPFGLDLCSGVRTDGRLDQAKLDAFMAAVRAA